MLLNSSGEYLQPKTALPSPSMFSRLLKRGGAGVLVAIATSLAWGQGGDESSLPSIPDFFQQKGIPQAQGFEAQSANEVINNFTGSCNITLLI